MKDNCIIVGVIIVLLTFGYMLHEAQADELEPIGLIQVNEPTTFDVVQHLYDQAIYEIAEGDRDRGCRILHQAFAHSTGLDDDWKAYNQIWEVGNKACNWTLRPDTMEASVPKQ